MSVRIPKTKKSLNCHGGWSIGGGGSGELNMGAVVVVGTDARGTGLGRECLSLLNFKPE